MSLFCCLVFFLLSPSLISQPVLGLTQVISGLSSPMQVVNAGDGTGRLFVAQKGGAIRVFGPGPGFADLGTFLTVTGITTNGERGLLSLVFHPDYADNGFFFVYYTNAVGSLELARYSVSDNPNVADADSRVILLTIPHPGQSNHNGGEMHFGSDGNLYLSTGDGGGGGDPNNNAQNTTVLLGKMLRLTVNTSATPPYYSVPAGNPFGNEIYDLGLRNPFRWSFDRQTGDMWIGDVGQDSWEEINFRSASVGPGVNHGWRCYEGNSSYNTSGCGPMSNYSFPAYTYATQNPSAAITGGSVYRGADTRLQGYYIGADFYSGTFYKILRDGDNWLTYTQTLSPTGIVDFGEDEEGELYAVSLNNGAVYSVSVTSVVPVNLVRFTAKAARDGIELSWQTATERNALRFDLEYSTDGTNFSKFGSVTAKNLANGATYSFIHRLSVSGRVFYRLKMVDIDGSFEYSDIINLLLNAPVQNNFVQPSVVEGKILQVILDASYHTVELVSATGRVMARLKLSGSGGRTNIPVSQIPAGSYIVRAINNEGVLTQRIIVR
ncbi:MAG TPA: PQQ-dependent sugar dehydrogenase [Parasegetibacter sp.]